MVAAWGSAFWDVGRAGRMADEICFDTNPKP
jgi:predicted alpha/beta hydrolase family esterase